jgi:hypothetical protein
MADPIDLLTPTQDAFYAALKQGVSPNIANVRQHVKENTPPPLLIVGTIESDDEGGKHQQLERMQVEIQSVYRGADRRVLLAIMHAARVAIMTVGLVAEGVQFHQLKFMHATASDAADDGVTYAGISFFEVFCEPA